MTKAKQQPETEQRRDAWESTPDMVVETIEQKARQYYADERLDRALELTEKLVRMRPEVSQYWALLGVVHRRLDELVPALQYLQEAVDLEPTNRNALVNLGECLVIAGKLKEGADVLRAVFEMGYDQEVEPEDHDVFTKRAGAQLAILQKVVEDVEAPES